jgi:hypothetical protein
MRPHVLALALALAACRAPADASKEAGSVGAGAHAQAEGRADANAHADADADAPADAPAHADAGAHADAVRATARIDKRAYARDRDVEVRVTIENGTGSPVELAAQVLSSAQLLLEVRDARGAVVHPMPPPTPTGAMTRIPAGGKIESTMHLGVFSPPLAPGEYTVAVRAGDPFAASTPVPFRITAGGP